MAWQASLKSVVKSKGIATVTITYANGAETFDKSYQIGSPGNDFVKSQARQELRNLADLDAYIAATQAGVIDTTVAAPTAAEAAASDFFAGMYAWLNMQQAISRGFLAADAPAVLTLTQKLKDNFKPAYLTDFRWR